MSKGTLVILFLALAVSAGGMARATSLDNVEKSLDVCEGTVGSVNPSGPSLTVSGIEIFMGPETKFLRETDAMGTTERASFSDIKKGDYVTVSNSADSSGNLVADTVTVKKEAQFDRFSTVTL
jgi:hypothetical protein